jgi:hypothetical protein
VVAELAVLIGKKLEVDVTGTYRLVEVELTKTSGLRKGYPCQQLVSGFIVGLLVALSGSNGHRSAADSG